VSDLSGAIRNLASGTYVVTRRAAGAYGADGRLDVAASTTLQIRAVAHPASGATLERLPEGKRTSDTMSVFTETELRTASPTQAPDKITIDGADYEVQTVERWSVLGNYFHVVVGR
jgi:hypothetical protein